MNRSLLRILRAGLAGLVAAALLAGCATRHGPRTVILGAAEVERELQVDLGRTLEAFRGLDVRRPEVFFLPAAGRVLLSWSVRLPVAAADNPLLGSVVLTVGISGRPRLDPSRTRVDLAEVRIEDLRVGGLSAALGAVTVPLPGRVGAQLPDLPLLPIAPDLLRIRQVVYAVRAVEVGFTGLRLDIAPQ